MANEWLLTRKEIRDYALAHHAMDDDCDCLNIANLQLTKTLKLLESKGYIRHACGNSSCLWAECKCNGCDWHAVNRCPTCALLREMGVSR